MLLMQWTIFNLETEYIIGSFRDQEEVRIISLRLGSSAVKVFSRVSLFLGFYFVLFVTAAGTPLHCAWCDWLYGSALCG